MQKGTAVAQMVVANEVPDTVVADGMAGTPQTCRWTKKGHTGLSGEERRKILFEKLGTLRSQVMDGRKQE